VIRTVDPSSTVKSPQGVSSNRARSAFATRPVKRKISSHGSVLALYIRRIIAPPSSASLNALNVRRPDSQEKTERDIASGSAFFRRTGRRGA